MTNSKNLKSSDLEISLAAIKKCNQQVQQISDFSQSIDKQKIPIDEKIKSLTSESKKDKSPLNREIQTPKKLPNNNIEKSI